MENKKRFSVKGTLYVGEKYRKTDVDGPWKPTVEEAIQAYADKLIIKGLQGRSVYKCFVAERVELAVAPCKDSRGVPYKGFSYAPLKQDLAQLGIVVENIWAI